MQKEIIKKILKEFIVGRKIHHFYECVDNNSFGMKNGQKVSEDVTVYSVKRIRRQWEEPGKEITFESVYKNKNGELKPCYSFMYTSELKLAMIKELPNGFQVIYNMSPSIIHFFTFH